MPSGVGNLQDLLRNPYGPGVTPPRSVRGGPVAPGRRGRIFKSGASWPRAQPAASLERPGRISTWRSSSGAASGSSRRPGAGRDCGSVQGCGRRGGGRADLARQPEARMAAAEHAVSTHEPDKERLAVATLPCRVVGVQAMLKGFGDKAVVLRPDWTSRADARGTAAAAGSYET